MNLDDLKLNTDIFETIIAPNVHAEINSDGNSLRLSMGISAKGLIEGIHLKQDGFDSYVPYFSFIRLILLKQNISKIFELNWTDLLSQIDDLDDYPVFPLPLYLMRSAASKYLGHPPHFCLLKNIEPQDLICHCFGVTYQDMRAKIKVAGADYEFKNLQEDLLISSGCGTCLPKANEHFKSMHSQMYSDFKIVNGHGLLYWATQIIKKLELEKIEAHIYQDQNGKVKVKTSEQGCAFLKKSYDKEIVDFLI